MPIDEAVKELLEDAKALACSAREIVGSQSADDLSLTEKAMLDSCLDSLYSKTSRLLDSNTNPSFDPPDAGSDYTPIDTTGFDLPRYANVTCQEACDALDDYCNENTDDSARYARRVHGIIFQYEDEAGLT